MQNIPIGSIVRNTALHSVNTPVTGGFPWSREAEATVVAFHPDGTSWAHMENTGPNTYMIQYPPVSYMSNTIYPAKEDHLEVVKLGTQD